MKPQRCFEFYKCEKTACPAFQSDESKCWLIPNTLCNKEENGVFLEKIEMCINCEFFKSNMDYDSMQEALSLTVNRFSKYQKEINDKESRLENINLELTRGFSEISEALNRIASGDPAVRISEDSEIEPVGKLKGLVNRTAENIAEIVDLSHEFAIGLAEHFDVLNRVASGDLTARVSGSSKVGLMESLKA